MYLFLISNNLLMNMQSVSLIFNGVAVSTAWVYKKKKKCNKMKSKTITKRDVHLPRTSNRKGLL